MGWNGAGEIFEPIACALIGSNLEEEMIEKVLTLLINQLQQADWDTEEESLEEFLDHPAVVRAFDNNDVRRHDKCGECGRDYD